MENDLISIVLPIYNVENYLERCIKSVISQTYKNLEIILVDDGSTDDCSKMCDEWAEKDNRIVVVHKNNQGLGMARNTGIEYAKGRFICFFDSDDFIENDMIENVYKVITKENAEMACFGYNVIKKDKIVQSNIPELKQYFYEGDDVIKVFLPELISENPKTGKKSGLNMSAWSCMYSKELIEENNWRFVSERKIISEDIYSLLYLYKNVKRVAVVKKAFYNYCENPNSLTQTYREDRYIKIKYFYQMSMQACEELAFSEDIKMRINYPYLANTIAAMKQIVNSNEERKNKRNNLKNILYDDVLNEVLKKVKRNKFSLSRKILFFLMRKKALNLIVLLIWLNEKRKN